MRLFEFATPANFIDSLVTTLNLIRDDSNAKTSTGELSYLAIGQMMSRESQMSPPANKWYEIFDKAYNESPALQAIVKNYNGKGIILDTDKKEPKNPAGPNMAKTDQGVSQTTQNAASSGAAATLKNS